MQVTHKELDELLSLAKASISAAETHGMQVGIICANTNRSREDWLSILLEELDCLNSSTGLREILGRLYKQDISSFDGIEFSFQPLLPDDDTDLAIRVQALADWCRGFLCGLGLAGITEEKLATPEAKEAVTDISQIAYVVSEDDDEENETALFEILEYIRAAVQSLQIELKDSNGSSSNINYCTEVSTSLH
ncbi:MAG: UPF0149 family protein [Francisellaceae bacterium]|jgi:uncharacterized protein|nr:UPF0149 family protein [Francisellaceae bacterium]MBT6208132.1 UPF0149 family protein [Francisellaceae bacterium]MBT6539921.1 UPF0149 family protein [Francisellaceae bacterium]